MAADNKVRVTFEAYTDQLQSRVRDVVQDLTGLGTAGENAGKKVDMKPAQESAARLSDKLRDTGRNATELGEKGERAGRSMKTGLNDATSSADKLHGMLGKIAGLLAVGFVVGKVKGAIGGYLKEANDLAVDTAQSFNVLATVMRNTMGASDETIESIRTYAEAQEQLGVISSTVQLSAAKELATYVEHADTLKMLMPAMNDYLAHQYGMNVSTEAAYNSAVLFGKVLDGQTGALRRNGFVFEETEEAILKYGTETERAAMLTEVLTRYVGGVNYELANAETGIGVLANIGTVTEVTKRKFGEMVMEAKTGIAGALLPSLNSLSERFLTAARNALDAAQSSGAFEKIAQGLSRIIEYLGDLLVRAFEALPGIIDGVANAFQWLSENASQLFENIKTGVTAFIALKAALGIIGIISGLIKGISSLIGVIKSVTVVTKIFNIVLNMNPIMLVVTAIGLLITALITLYNTSDTARRYIDFAFNAIKLGVLTLARVWLTQFQLMGKAIEILIGWIPGIGDAVKTVTGTIDKLMDGIDGRILKTARNMDDLMKGVGKTAETIGEKTAPGTGWGSGYTPWKTSGLAGGPDGPAEGPTAASHDWDAVLARIEAEQKELEKPKAGGAKDNRTAFEKAMDKVSDTFATRRGRIESQIALQEARGNIAGRRTAQQELIDMIQEKLVRLTGIEGIAKTLDERNLLETARNKLMTELVNIGNDMKGSLDKLVGSFNTPSELAAMSQYAYNVGRGNSFMTRVISTPAMNMYLTIRDLGGASAAQVRDQAMGFMDNIFRKDEVVSSGMEDITRNM